MNGAPAKRVTPPGAAIRSDVQRNRQALLDAARELFATSSDVPLYEVARRAGLGQATLYRHFPDRQTLAAAIAEDLVQELEGRARRLAEEPECFAVLLGAVAEQLARSGGLVDVICQHHDAASQLEQLKRRLVGLLEPSLRRAREAGVVRADVGMPEVLFLLTMVQGALREAPPEPAARAAAARRALDFLLHGVLDPHPPSTGKAAATA